jgi:hypothetical protein
MTSKDRDVYKDNRFLLACFMLGALLTFLISTFPAS